jgi:rare lipoprotein A
MLPPRLSAAFMKLGFNALLGRLALPIFLIALLGGCASEPSFRPSDDQAALPSDGDQAPYNKPYQVKGKTYYPLVSASGYREKGLASWYGSESGNRTATGRRFNPKGLSAAHKTLPLPCKVRVTNLRNGRYIDVEVNDRGPFNDDRLIDLSHGAAKQIGMRGTTEVEIEYLEN